MQSFNFAPMVILIHVFVAESLKPLELLRLSGIYNVMWSTRTGAVKNIVLSHFKVNFLDLSGL